MRDLGAFESAYEMWSRDRPMHFCLVAELSGGLTPAALAAALLVVQRRHPLLAARVVDEPAGTGAAPAHFEPTDHPIAHRVQTSASWEQVVGNELATPFEAGGAPLARVVLVPASDVGADRAATRGPGTRGSDVLVLTLSHTIADGFSARLVLQEVVAVLNGEVLPSRPTPRSQEALLDELTPPTPTAVADGGPSQPPQPSAQLAQPSVLRRFDHIPPEVTSLAWTRSQSEELYRGCRQRGVSVNGALVAAALEVLAESGGPDQLRVNIPYSLRDLLPAGQDVALYIGGLRPVLSRADRAGGLWSVAEEITRAAAAAKSPAGALAVSTGIRAIMGLDRAAATEQLSIAQGMDLMVSNLGRVQTARSGRVTIEALWGPAVLSHFEGEEMVGVLTHGDRLRTVHVGHGPTPELLPRIRTLLLGRP